MKNLILFLIIAFCISCKKESKTCGVIESIRVCGVCAQQPSYIIEVKQPNGIMKGLQVFEYYKPGTTYCE